jgi:cation transport regulator
MPYRSNDDLPPSVRDHLPDHACDIYCAAFNRAFVSHIDDSAREHIAASIAWSAAKWWYKKVGDMGSGV